MAKRKASRTYNEIIDRLENLKEHCKDMARDKDAAEVWAEDVEALTEACDIIHDYEAAVEQANDLIRKYETPLKAIKRAPDFYQCPACNKRTSRGHTHCHWCGQLLTY